MTSTAALPYVLSALLCLPWLAPSAAAQGQWAGVVTELSTPGVCGRPVVGLDANGDGIAVWSVCDGIQWARYSRASDAWTGPQSLFAVDWAVPSLFVHPGGHAVVTWSVINDDESVEGAWASVYDSDTATWTAPGEFSRDGQLVGGVVDSHGKAIVAWVETPSTAVFKTAAYDHVAEVWNMAADIHVLGALNSPRLTLGANDQAIVLGQTADGVTRVGRFLPSIGAWSDAVALAGQGIPNIATDSMGNMTVVWVRLESGVVRFQASHYRASSGAWSEPAGVAINAPGASVPGGDPALASDEAGNAIAVWEWSDGQRWTIVSATYHAPVDSWGAIASVTLGPNPSRPQARFDPLGNATVVWSDSSAGSVDAARRSADGSWSLVTLAPSGAHSPSLDIDPAGNAAVAWTSKSVIHTTRWQAAPAAPTITDATTNDGTVAILATTPPSPAWFANINYEYSLDDGVTWTTRSPASTTFPLEISGLVNGVLHQLRLRGVNSAGPGLPSAAIPVVAGLLPPANLTASIVGNTVTLQWSIPAGAGPPTGYVLEGGLAPGEVLQSMPIQGATQTFTFTAPTGAFFIRLHATMSGIRSLASNEIQIRVGPAPGTAFLLALVVDPSGLCIDGATVQVVGGQRVGTTMTQMGPCGAWDYGNEILLTGLTPGVEMTLLVSAPGYEPRTTTVIPTPGPRTAVLLGLSPLVGPAPGTAFLMVMAVDASGICIVGATVEVIGGQRAGTTMTQSGACDAWWFAEIEFVGLTPGVEMTLRVSAPGYSPQVVTVIPTSGPQTALVLELSPNGSG